MTESIYKEFENKYYNPDDNDKRPGDNDNWKSIQEGFSKISSTQLETSAGLTLGKGTEDETSVTAAELAQMKQSGENKATLMKVETYNFSSARTYESVNILDDVKFTVHGLKPYTKYNLLIVNLWLNITGAKAPALRSSTLAISNKTSDNGGNIIDIPLGTVMISDTSVTSGGLVAMIYAEEV